MKKEFSVKKRTAFLAATLSAAMAFSAAPAVAETASDASTTATDASNESTTSDQEEQSTSEDSGQTNNGKTQEDSDTADSGNDKDGEEGKDGDGDGDGDKDKKSDSLDPTKGTWDKNGASSNPAPSEPFGSSGMNRLSAYLDSNHFKMITLIVTIFSAVVTVGSQLAAIAVTVSPAAKAQFDAFLNQLG